MPSPATVASPAESTAYAKGATALLDALAAASEQVSAVMQHPDVASPSWRDALTVALATFGDIEARTQQLDAPTAFADVQLQLVAVVAEFQHVAALLRGSIDPPDTAGLEEAVQTLADAIARAAALRATLPAS